MLRLPPPYRCVNLTSLQLVNIYLEQNTLQVIAASCPLLQRLTLTGAAAGHIMAQHGPSWHRLQQSKVQTTRAKHSGV
jgi:hypothetical protein